MGRNEGGAGRSDPGRSVGEEGAHAAALPLHVERSIRAHLERSGIGDTLREHLMVVDSHTGKILDQHYGDETSIDLAHVRDATMADNVLVHNHPFGGNNVGGAALSDGDVIAAIRHNAREIRAVGREADGKMYQTRFIRPKTGWPPDILDRAGLTFNQGVEAQYGLAGRLKSDPFSPQMWDHTLRKMARSMGATYVRQRIENPRANTDEPKNRDYFKTGKNPRAYRPGEDSQSRADFENGIYMGGDG